MSYPSGVITRQVIVGPFLDLSGDIITGQVQVESSVSLTWAATGVPILARPETIFLDTNTGQGSITLPTVQQGFVTGALSSVVGTWTYLLTPILEPNTPIVPPLVLTLGFGDGTPITVDFNSPNPSTNGAVLFSPGAKGDPGPQGVPGPANTLTIGAVSTLSPGSSATASVQGGAPNQILNLGIPQGAAGANGSAAGVPVGGSANQVLTKIDGTDFHTQWANNAAQGIPAGGLASQVLQKVDGTDYNTTWVSITLQIPNGGSAGTVLTKNTGTDQDFGWQAVPFELPVGGTTGQVLAKSSNTDRAVGWVTPSAGGGTGLPAGGTAGQILSKNSSTDGDASWKDPVFSINTLPSFTVLGVIKPASGVWPIRPSARADLIFIWIGSDPAPTIVSSGTGGMLDGVDLRMVTP